MKRILIVSNMFPSDKHPSFGIFVRNQVNLLKKSGLDVAVIANDNPDKGKGNLLKKYSSWFARYMKYVSAHRKEISVIHAHYLFPTGLLALASKRMFGIPYAVTAHGGDLDQMPNKSGRIRQLTASVLENADEVIVVGEGLKKDAQAIARIDEARLHVISMGVDTEIFRPYPKEEVEGLLPDGQGPVLLFVGNIIRAKGLLELMEAFQTVQRRHPHAALHLIGSRKDRAFVDELEAKITELGLNSVHFQEPLPQQEVAKWMNAADVLVLPSHIEGFGLVALEGMAAGIPVAGSAVGGLKHLLADRRGVLFEKQNSSDMAEKVLQLIEHEKGAIDWDNVHAIVKENSFETIQAKLLRIYEGMSRADE